MPPSPLRFALYAVAFVLMCAFVAAIYLRMLGEMLR